MNPSVSSRYTRIGIDRIIRLKWLEQTAYLALAGQKAPAIKTILQKELQPEFPGSNSNVRGSLNKTITILMRVWVRPLEELFCLQQDGLELIATLPREYHIIVHWGMIMAVYPFWSTVASYVGRLLELQGRVVARQIQRRMREHYGERETVSRAVQRVLRSFIDWGVLKETSSKGVYTQGMSQDIKSLKLIAWLVEAFLHAQPEKKSVLRAILNATSLFPFHLSLVSGDQLAGVFERLQVLRHDLDQDLIMLGRVS